MNEFLLTPIALKWLYRHNIFHIVTWHVSDKIYEYNETQHNIPISGTYS